MTETHDRPTTSLAGCRAVVTGASSGLGAIAARALLEAGATVGLVGRRADRLDDVAAEYANAVSLPADLSDEQHRGELIPRAVAAFGGLDVLVNAAGVTNPVRALVERSEDALATVEFNLLATYHLCREAAAVMKGSGGSIVNVASIIAVVSEPTIPQASYAASKGGLVSLSRELAVQWGRYRIRVNALLPGWFPTEMTSDLVDDAEHSSAMASRVPLGRFGHPTEIGGPVVFLASDASSYMTGQSLVIDGGLSCV